jgi:hypothetical protein
MSSSIKILVLCLVLLFGVAPSFASEIRLRWNPNSEDDLAGYRLYESWFSGEYTKGEFIEEIPAGTETVSVFRYSRGMRYYALTAFDTSGNESGFSNEVNAYIDGKPGNVIVVKLTWKKKSWIKRMFKFDPIRKVKTKILEIPWWDHTRNFFRAVGSVEEHQK